MTDDIGFFEPGPPKEKVMKEQIMNLANMKEHLYYIGLDENALRLAENCFRMGQRYERNECANIADKEMDNCNMLTNMPPISSAAWNIAVQIRARDQ